MRRFSVQKPAQDLARLLDLIMTVSHLSRVCEISFCRSVMASQRRVAMDLYRELWRSVGEEVAIA